MKKTFLIKGITLFSSLLLVTVFLLYRIGAFDESSFSNQADFQTSYNKENISPLAFDTSILNSDSINSLMFSSSKVLILTDKRSIFFDSLKKKPAKHTYQKRSTEILSSSKSAIIFGPQQRVSLNRDSFMIKSDTVHTIKKKD